MYNGGSTVFIYNVFSSIDRTKHFKADPTISLGVGHLVQNQLFHDHETQYLHNKLSKSQPPRTGSSRSEKGNMK
jgi:hypothetical protein